MSKRILNTVMPIIVDLSLAAIHDMTLASAELHVTYARKSREKSEEQDAVSDIDHCHAAVSLFGRHGCHGPNSHTSDRPSDLRANDADLQLAYTDDSVANRCDVPNKHGARR
jgi:hypothetical protein